MITPNETIPSVLLPIMTSEMLDAYFASADGSVDADCDCDCDCAEEC
jgi:hypothetical protein